MLEHWDSLASRLRKVSGTVSESMAGYAHPGRQTGLRIVYPAHNYGTCRCQNPVTIPMKRMVPVEVSLIT